MPHALIVDDEPDVVGWMAEVVQAEGYTVATADTLRNARAQLVRQPPDVLLTDIAMPSQDGFSLLKRIRTQEAAAPVKTPTAAITAFGWDEVKTRILSAGFDKYLPKPIEAESLIRLVFDLSQHSARAKLRQKTG